MNKLTHYDPATALVDDEEQAMQHTLQKHWAW